MYVVQYHEVKSFFYNKILNDVIPIISLVIRLSDNGNVGLTHKKVIFVRMN